MAFVQGITLCCSEALARMPVKSERHLVVQCVAFYTVVRLFDAGVGIVSRADADFMPAREAQTETNAVFEVEGRTELAIFNLGVGEHRDADTGFYVRLDVAVAELVDQNRENDRLWLSL